ncbi:MAG: hypothetical protein AAFX03_11490 [Pseudomonadota bacterium]
MPLSAQKREQLSAFLGGLPTATAVKLFEALEADRIASARNPRSPSLPHSELLEDLRQRLLRKGARLPDRRADARRLFFTPFEDFFIATRRGRKRPGLIPRASLPAIWRLMMRDAALSEAAFAAASLDEAVIAGRPTDDLLRALFIAAEAGLARLCDAAIAEAGARQRLEAALGGEAVFADLQELRRLLSGVDFLIQLQSVIPAGAGGLKEDDLYALRDLFLSAHERSPKLAAFLLLALKGRLERPWSALALYYHFARGADERLEAARDAAAALPEALFEDLESLARALEKDGADADSFDAEAARLRVSWFADYADGLAGQAAKIGDNALVNRVEACRDVAAEAFERFCELGLAGLRRAAPTRQSSGSSHLMAQRPDITAALAPGVVSQAREAAAMIALAPSLAGRLGAAADIAAGIAEDAREKLKSYANDLVTEIRAAEGAERKTARTLLDQTLSIGEPLLDREEAGLIRDRAKTASLTV